MSAPLAPGTLAKVRKELGHRFIHDVASEDCHAIYLWGDPDVGGQGVVVGVFHFPGVLTPELQRVCRVVPSAGILATPMHELTTSLAAMLDKLGPMPADVWGCLHGVWLRTPDGFATFEANADSGEEERVLINDWCHFSTLHGQTSLEWTMSEVGSLIDPRR